MKPLEILKKVANDAKTVRMEITIGEEEKLELASLGIEIRKKVEEIADNVDFRWKVTHWLIGIGMCLNIVASYIFLTA